MADKEAAAGKSGWLKAILGTFGGALSGAAVMYVTTLVDSAVKPGKPVANFKVEYLGGLNVRIQNLSTGSQGWWDFGDGSPLEPVVPNSQFVPHTYPRAGNYTVKLSLHNILGDENDRSVNIQVDATSAATDATHITSLEVTPVSNGSYAPATFRLAGVVQNTQLCILDAGDDRKLERIDDMSRPIDKLLTYDKPGGYVVKLAAFNGTQYDEKTEIITVMEPPVNSLTAILTTTDQGTRVETRSQQFNFGVAFPPEQNENTYGIDRQAAAQYGCTIKDVRVQGVNGKTMQLGNKMVLQLDADFLGLRNVESLYLTLAEDRKSVQLKGELIRPASAGKDPNLQPSLVLPVQLIEQRELTAERAAQPVTTTLAIPSGGVTSSGLLMLPPPPPNWVNTQRKLKLEIREGTAVVWQAETQLPQNVLLTLNGRKVQLSATLVNDQVHLDLRENAAGIKPAAN
jgi:PKD repeat protein